MQIIANMQHAIIEINIIASLIYDQVPMLCKFIAFELQVEQHDMLKSR